MDDKTPNPVDQLCKINEQLTGITSTLAIIADSAADSDFSTALCYYISSQLRAASESLEAVCITLHNYEEAEK